MTIDLGRELAAVARSVHDDDTGERMTAQVGHMVGRIKRRRAVRHTATGAVGLSAAAAVTLGGVQLAGRGDVAPPATTPTPTPTPMGFGTCGSAIVDPNAGTDPVLGLDATVQEMPDGDTPQAVLDVSFVGDTDSLVSLGEIRMVAAQDGVVVSTLGDLTLTRESFPPSYTFTQDLVSCEDGTVLPEGSYEIYAQQALTTQDPGLTAVLGGPWVVTVGEPDAAAPTEEPEPEATAGPTDPQAALDALLASAPVANPDFVYPMCGTRASDVLDDGMPPLELDLTEPELTLAAGSTYQSTVRLKTALVGYAIGNASPNATLVVLKDGIVVGYQFLDAEDLTLVDLADGETQEFSVLGAMTLCGTGEGGTGDAIALPPGDYRFQASLDVMVKEIDGESVTYTMPAVSEVGYLTVTP